MVACLTHELLLNTGPSRAQPVRSFTDGEGASEREGGGSTIERQERAEPKSEAKRRARGASAFSSPPLIPVQRSSELRVDCGGFLRVAWMPVDLLWTDMHESEMRLKMRVRRIKEGRDLRGELDRERALVGFRYTRIFCMHLHDSCPFNFYLATLLVWMHALAGFIPFNFFTLPLCYGTCIRLSASLLYGVCAYMCMCICKNVFYSLRVIASL